MNVALYVVYVTRYAISWCNFNDQMWWYWAEWSRYEICLRAFYWQIRALNNAHSPYERSGFFLANYNGNIPFTLKRIIYGFNPVQEKKNYEMHRTEVGIWLLLFLLCGSLCYFRPNKLAKQFNNFVFTTIWLLHIYSARMGIPQAEYSYPYR